MTTLSTASIDQFDGEQGRLFSVRTGRRIRVLRTQVIAPIPQCNRAQPRAYGYHGRSANVLDRALHSGRPLVGDSPFDEGWEWRNVLH